MPSLSRQLAAAGVGLDRGRVVEPPGACRGVEQHLGDAVAQHRLGEPAPLRRLEADLVPAVEDLVGDESRTTSRTIRFATPSRYTNAAGSERPKSATRRSRNGSRTSRSMRHRACGRRSGAAAADGSRSLASSWRRSGRRRHGRGRRSAGRSAPSRHDGRSPRTASRPGGARSGGGARAGGRSASATPARLTTLRSARASASAPRAPSSRSAKPLEWRVAGEQLVAALAVEQHGHSRASRLLHHAPLRVDAERSRPAPRGRARAARRSRATSSAVGAMPWCSTTPAPLRHLGRVAPFVALPAGEAAP